MTRNLTLHYDRMMLLLDPTPLARGLVRKKVEVVNYPDGRFAVQFNGATLGFKVFDKIQTVQPGAIARSFCPYRAGGRGPLSLARTLWAPPSAPICRAARRRRCRSCRGNARRSPRGRGMDARPCRLRRNVARCAARQVSGIG